MFNQARALHRRRHVDTEMCEMRRVALQNDQERLAVVAVAVRPQPDMNCQWLLGQ